MNSEFDRSDVSHIECVVSAACFTAREGCKLQKDCCEQTRCEFTTGISMCKFQKDRDKQARCEFTRVISMEACQFQKDRSEQARCEFKRVLSL